MENIKMQRIYSIFTFIGEMGGLAELSTSTR